MFFFKHEVTGGNPMTGTELRTAGFLGGVAVEFFFIEVCSKRYVCLCVCEYTWMR